FLFRRYYSALSGLPAMNDGLFLRGCAPCLARSPLQGFPALASLIPDQPELHPTYQWSSTSCSVAFVRMDQKLFPFPFDSPTPVHHSLFRLAVARNTAAFLPKYLLPDPIACRWIHKIPAFLPSGRPFCLQYPMP